MTKETFTVTGAGGQRLFVRCYKGEDGAGEVVHVLHGMAEYGDRYEGFAKFLADRGITVYVQDHRKHGFSISGSQKVGYYTDDTWEQMVEDVDHVQREILKREGVDQVVLLGHSMGSFLTRNYLMDYGEHVKKAVIVGTGDTENPVAGIGKVLAKVLGRFAGHKPSPFLDNMAVGAYNKAFKPARTTADWLTRDEAICDWYVESPLCGYAYTPKFYEEIINGTLYIAKEENIAKTPKIPLLFISGAKDPVGGMGEGVKKVKGLYDKLGYNTDMTLYEDARHEIFNELNKEDVYERVVQFVN